VKTQSNVNKQGVTAYQLALAEPGIEEWSNTRQTSNERSKKSLVTFIGIVRRFANERGLAMPLLKMTTAEAAKLGNAMRGRGFSSAIFVALRSFFAYHELPKQAKAFKVNKKQARMNPDEILTTDEVNRLIAAAGNMRDQAMLAVLADTGIRIHEACALKLRDVKTEVHSNGTDVTFVKLWIGKTKTLGEERNILMEPEASAIVLSFVKAYPRDIKGGNERPLFPSHANSNYGGHTNPNSWQGRMKEIAAKAGFAPERAKAMHPHLLRHYMATRLLRAGWTEPMVKSRGGWAPSSTVMSVYSHLVDSDVHNETLVRNGFKVERAAAEPLKVPVGQVPAMPPQWIPGNVNINEAIGERLGEMFTDGTLEKALQKILNKDVAKLKALESELSSAKSQ